MYCEAWPEDGKASRSKRSRKPPLSTSRRRRRSHSTRAPEGLNARRFHWHERTSWLTCSAPAHPRIVRCSNRRLPISIGGWLTWKIPKAKSQIPNPKRAAKPMSLCVSEARVIDVGIWDLGFGIWDLLSSPLRRLARNATPIATTTAVGELLHHEAARNQFPCELRLTRRARRSVFEFVRRLRVAGAVHEQARAPFRRGRANQPHRLGATHEQPDCLDEAGDQGAPVYLTASRTGNDSGAETSTKRNQLHRASAPVTGESTAAATSSIARKPMAKGHE